jgi:hypothetical protein
MDIIRNFLLENEYSEILINVILVYHDVRKAAYYWYTEYEIDTKMERLIRDLNLCIVEDDESSFYIMKSADKNKISI